MHQPKLENETKYQQQTESSVFSSKYYEHKLSSRDKYKLEHLSDHLSKTIIALRNKKIEILEKQSDVMTQKLEIEEKIKHLQEMKIKRRVDESIKYEKLMLQLYKKRQLVQEKLKEVEAEYKQKKDRKQNSIDLSKAYQHQNLQQKTKSLEEEIGKIQSLRKQQLSNHSFCSKQQLFHQITFLQTKKNQIFTKRAEERRKQIKKELKKLRCDEIKQVLLQNNIKIRIPQIFDLLNQCKWKEYKTAQIEQYVLSERSQKQTLFHQITKMNDELKKMQEQNSNMQVFLRQSINK